jgi:beta-glucosidase
MSKEYVFPEDFDWGTATSAHQIEGNNTNSDWWAWENEPPKDRGSQREPSDGACDSYNRYEEDFDLCKKLNNNAVRLSIEWARIEPEEGKFSKKELDHYREVLKAAKKRGLQTFVTLHHFTNPLWFSKKGDWRTGKSAFYFARYAQKVAKELDLHIDKYLTINEPQVLALMSYTLGMWPPCKKNPLYSLQVQINTIRAHRKAYDAIKKESSKPVGIVKNVVWYEPAKGGFKPLNYLVAKFLYWLNNDFFLRPVLGKSDILGVNYYFTNRIKNFRLNNPDAMVLSDMRWWVNPAGLEKVLLDLRKYNIPLYITENGIADAQDRLRPDFIRSMLISCAKAIEKNVPLKGYFHWSLLDNFEWHHGYWPRFGLVEIDRDNNLKRTPRKSFKYYAQICKSGKISV